MISQERIAGYLDRLASGQPTPGGGATAAVQLAQAAALLSMAANFSGGDGGPAERFGSAARQLIPQALAIADADEHAFGEAASAYELPADTPEDKAHRSNEVQSGLRKAAAPPLRLAELAAELLDLARGLEPEANPNVLSDISAAAESIRSAAGTAAATLETNAASLTDDAAVQRLQDAAAAADEVAAASGTLAGRLRMRIRGDNS